MGSHPEPYQRRVGFITRHAAPTSPPDLKKLENPIAPTTYEVRVVNVA